MKQIDQLNAILEPLKIRKVSTHIHLSHILEVFVYSIVICVPDPFRKCSVFDGR